MMWLTLINEYIHMALGKKMIYGIWRTQTRLLHLKSLVWALKSLKMLHVHTLIKLNLGTLHMLHSWTLKVKGHKCEPVKEASNSTRRRKNIYCWSKTIAF